MIGNDRMRYLAGLLEREVGASLRPGVGRFNCVTQAFGFRAKISEAIERDLHELAAVRNVIVHRAGTADERLVELCPWLDLSVGHEVEVSSEGLHRYMRATSYYAAALIEAAREKVQGLQDH